MAFSVSGSFHWPSARTATRRDWVSPSLSVRSADSRFISFLPVLDPPEDPAGLAFQARAAERREELPRFAHPTDAPAINSQGQMVDVVQVGQPVMDQRDELAGFEIRPGHRHPRVL